MSSTIGRKVQDQEIFRHARDTWGTLITRRPFASPVAAYLIVAGLYIGGRFLEGTVKAGGYLILRAGGDPIRPAVDPDYHLNVFWHSLSAIVLSMVVLTLFLKLMDVRPRAVLAPGPPSSVGFFTILYIFLTIIGAAAMAALAPLFNFEPAFPHPSTDGPWAFLGMMASSFEAGFTEEIFLVIIPVLLLRSIGQRWWVIVAVLTVLRISFHVYYGWPSLGLLVWAVGALVFFYFTRCGIALIIGHGLRNFLGTLSVLYGEELTTLAVLLLLLLVFVFRFFMRRTDFDPLRP